MRRYTGAVPLLILAVAGIHPVGIGPQLGAAERAQSQPPILKIVVIAGEDAVNIIQQKTAVSPVVEVRDRNGLPVPGAVVTFALGGGKAATFAGGSSTFTVATNAAGRAAAAALTPVAKGAVQIQVSAAFQGQAAAVAITQTNVMTAAEAAAAAGAGGAGSGGTTAGAGAAGGGGGGLSGTAIGLIAGGIGGGVFAATQASKGDSSSGPPGGAQTSPVLLGFAFSPGLNAISQCATYVGNGVGPNTFNASVARDGSFSNLISLLTPAATINGRMTPTDVTGTFNCVGGGGPVGSMNAAGTAQQYQGTWNWGGLSGTVTVRPVQ